jgi:hypothetical protein
MKTKKPNRGKAEKKVKKTYVCGECGGEFGTKSELRRHMLTAHPDKALEEEVAKDEFLSKLHRFVKWNLDRGVVIARYLTERGDLQADWREAFGDGEEVDMEEFVEGLERLMKLYKRFGRYLDYVAWTDDDGAVEEAAVAFDDPDNYLRLASDDECVEVLHWCGKTGWLVIDYCDHHAEHVGSLLEDYSGTSKLLAEE